MVGNTREGEAVRLEDIVGRYSVIIAVCNSNLYIYLPIVSYPNHQPILGDPDTVQRKKKGNDVSNM